MCNITDQYNVKFKGKDIGLFYIYDNNTIYYSAGYGCPWDMGEELGALGLDKSFEGEYAEVLIKTIAEENKVKGRKRSIYTNGGLELERMPKESGERFSVYRCEAEKGEPDYSPLPHDAAHREGEKTPEDMREWATWYAFVKMDDGTYRADLDESWHWGGGHNDGGTIRTEIPEDWFDLPYDEFLSKVTGLSAARHYGFTAEILKEKQGLKEFFGFR